MPEAGHANTRVPAGAARAAPRSPLIVLLLALALVLSWRPALAGQECVILLHGLTKDASSMVPLAQRLGEAGFHVVNIGYPSRQKPIQELAATAVDEGLAQCRQAGAAPVNFVTHSMGGLLVRYYFQDRPVSGIDRVVMLAPPNQGSRVGDWLDHIPWIKDVNGPAGRQMGTGDNSLPLQMGPVRFELGVITGDRSLNPFASAILEGPDDGRIRVESAKVEGMCAFYVVPLTHGAIMRDAEVIEQSLRFLWRGYFVGESAREYACGH
ncbi:MULTISPECIES: triacylglycerol lipase [unclassified Microbulbifer]|uniref:esterase/lipase family protein n=1 Tax=unclassified Microbulbifer TaxID=2619833 RepID=UPI001E5B030B|nr:alpha/beta fold hydrolase [Microbulbifer sp. YPW16]UHQ53832.1 alpha/beta fold hydrolase [Microbulbifer sp. YPW16]